MSYVDVLIPGVMGILLLVRPELFLKRREGGLVNVRKRGMLRGIGWLLVGVAGLYLVVKWGGG